jgi:hypothetical protein
MNTRATPHLLASHREVVVIEHILTLFSFDISREQLLQLGFPGGAPGESRAHDFFDREFGIDRSLKANCSKQRYSNKTPITSSRNEVIGA